MATAAPNDPGLPQDGLPDTPESVVVRFAGDSGDGMQLTGGQFTLSTALAGNDLATFPDFPAEIRAPQGTLFGVSAFQINFGSREINTAGDAPDVLVAMNPAALKVNLAALKPGGLIIADTGAFTKRNLEKAKYAANPLEDGSLGKFDVLAFDISEKTIEAVKPYGLGNKDALRSKNMWTLGLALWMFDRPREPIHDWLKGKFKTKPEIAEANIAALSAGHAYGETAELPTGVHCYKIPEAELKSGEYRNITGNEALAWGLAAGGLLAETKIVFGSYPITPASSVLHSLAKLKNFGVTTFQAEDEIAAVCASIGASFGGALGATATSGPGMALKGEAIGLAIMTELPLVILDIQRAGPSTGMPTKTEQADLMQAIYGRNSDAPLCVLAPRSPGDCFAIAVEACRIATKYMTPVIVLSDGFIANGAAPWKIPNFDDLEPFPVSYRTQTEGFHPFVRDDKTLARAWAIPGTPGLEHRIGGLEKSFDTGHISYDPANHHKMTKIREQKIMNIADDIPEQTVEVGESTGKVAVVGWGSTYGSIFAAVKALVAEGHSVSHVHLRHMWPMPKNTESLLRGFDKIIVPELNNGQLVRILRSEYLLPAEPLDKIEGQPFKVTEITAAVKEALAAG